MGQSSVERGGSYAAGLLLVSVLGMGYRPIGE